MNREIFINSETDELWNEGDFFTWPNLADTMELIGANGGEEFYTGQTGINMIADMQAAGGNMTLEDLMSYEYAYNFCKGNV